MLLVEYSIDGLLRNFVPTDVTRRHMRVDLDEQEQVLASTGDARMPGQARTAAPIVSDVPLTPALNGLVLRGQG